MFAFVIYDEKKNRLFGARDRFGEKPFYYNLQKQVFSFASEMKALWAIGAPRTFRKAAVERYINENSLIAENPELTFYKEINQLAPSEAFTLQLGNDQLELKKWKYWDLSGYALKTSGKLSFDEAMTQLKFHLNNSVKMRLRSDVPIGSSLSGGVDSSIIASLILNQEGTLDPFHTFTACSPGSPKDERALVELFVKSKKNIQSHTVNIDNNEFDTIFQKVCYHQEEPFLSTSILAQWKVMELANQKGITVLLDGQGADELFAGYLPYYRTHLYNLFSQNNKTYASELDHYNKIHPERPIKDFKDLETVRGKIGRLKNKIVKSQGISDTKKALIHDLSSGNLQLLLRFADRNSMAFSREVRLPYLSKALVEFVMSLPDNFLLRDGWTKYILRKTFDDQVLPEILWKTEKIGFEAPGIKHSDFVKSKIAKGRNFLTDNFDLKKESIEDWKLLNIGCFSEGIN
jgi:asparagine synthase (glutamine-hydrolysing)